MSSASSPAIACAVCTRSSRRGSTPCALRGCSPTGLPTTSFEAYGRAAGYWVSREAVDPLECVELGDLLQRHAQTGIELRLVPQLLPLWERVISSTLEFSGIRLRNL